MIDGKCSARRHSDGKPCQRFAVRGSTVCASHGGNAPQVKPAARKRLDQAADVLVQRLLSFALDGQVDDPIALRAIVAALDRAGFSVTQPLDVAIGSRPFELVFDAIAGGSRAESRIARGYNVAAEPPPALDAGPVVDAEMVESDPDHIRTHSVSGLDMPPPAAETDATHI